MLYKILGIGALSLAALLGCSTCNNEKKEDVNKVDEKVEIKVKYNSYSYDVERIKGNASDMWYNYIVQKDYDGSETASLNFFNDENFKNINTDSRVTLDDYGNDGIVDTILVYYPMKNNNKNTAPIVITRWYERKYGDCEELFKKADKTFADGKALLGIEKIHKTWEEMYKDKK